MGLKDELTREVQQTFFTTWEEQQTLAVPDPQDLRLNSNHAKDLETATVLYADLDGSTKMVQSRSWFFSAEVYKTYLRCASKLIRSEGGVITAYDGDRVMAIFTGNSKNTSSVRAAMKINWAVRNIIRPNIVGQYPHATDFQLNHSIGIDTSQLRAARIGVHGDNDLVWIGRAANFAAKLTAIPLQEQQIWITQEVYDALAPEGKEQRGTGISMWKKYRWSQMDDLPIYGSSWTWPFD